MKLQYALAAACMAAAGMMGVADVRAAYPERPVTMIVVFPPGGSTDLIGRAMQPAFGRALGVDVVVKNSGGGGGTIGTAEIAAARPDGYTIGLSPIGPTTTQPHLRSLPYDTLTSLTPICRVYNSWVFMTTAKDQPFQTLDDLVSKAKAEPRAVIYGSPAPGSIPHVVMVALEQTAGIEMRHVPFAGTADAVRAMLGGTINAYSDVSVIVPQYDLRALAVYAPERVDDLPDVPTMKEQGYDLQYSIWGGLFGPAGLAPEIVERLSGACETALQDPQAIEAMEKQRAPVAYQNADDFAAFVREQYERNGELLEAAGLKRN